MCSGDGGVYYVRSPFTSRCPPPGYIGLQGALRELRPLGITRAQLRALATQGHIVVEDGDYGVPLFDLLSLRRFRAQYGERDVSPSEPPDPCHAS